MPRKSTPSRLEIPPHIKHQMTYFRTPDVEEAVEDKGTNKTGNSVSTDDVCHSAGCTGSRNFGLEDSVGILTRCG